MPFAKALRPLPPTLEGDDGVSGGGGGEDDVGQSPQGFFKGLCGTFSGPPGGSSGASWCLLGGLLGASRGPVLLVSVEQGPSTRASEEGRRGPPS
eukprot:1769270-Pyramimonas_sp.AAC.1